jgi:hypothetical protein
MNYPIYSHDANPNVDRKLCRKSRAYCDELVLKGDAYWLPNHSGVHLFPPTVRAVEGKKPKDSFHVKSIDTAAAITARENRLNAEFRPGVKRNPGAVLRAHQKYEVWPEVFDTKAIRAGVRV